jgi:hypothetical protein
MSTYRANVISFGVLDFISAIKRASGTLKIVDPYFGLGREDDRSSGHFVVAAGLDKASKITRIQIITDKASDQDRLEATKLLKSNNERRVIDWISLQGTAIILHDRFAVTDRELWHFGADVGGAHKGLTMSTGAWCAQGTNANNFFDELWKVGGGHL